MLARLISIVLILTVSQAYSMVPERSKEYLGQLKSTIEDKWPALVYREHLAGQIEQETCPSLTHKKCWNPHCELKTEREYGFGLGQITVTPQFNNFLEIKKLDKKLNLWKWEERYDPAYQLLALVVYDKSIYLKVRSLSNSELDAMAFTFCAYNGGLGGLLKDRKLCESKPKCDSSKWFGHVELYSWRSKVKYQGYGKSFFDINREYVSNIILVRSSKYKSFLY